MYVCLCVCTLACVGTWARKWRAEASISWNWRCKQLWVTWMRYWELNSGHLKEQCVFLTSESFQQSPHLFLFHIMLLKRIISPWLWSSLIWLGWLANELSGSPHLYLRSDGFRDTCPCTQLLHESWGPEIGTSCLCSRHFIHWAILVGI